MSKTISLLRVFLASPSDVREERDMMDMVISEYNQLMGDTHGIRLELIKWETHTHPSIGDDAQDVINQQIGSDYDIFIGLMWGRFGSPTNRAESGTEEEFERAFERYKRDPRSIQIMFYFKDQPIPPSKIDTNQLDRVLRFKTKLGAEYGALIHTFVSTDEFRTKIRLHLSSIVKQSLTAAPLEVAEARKQEMPQRNSSILSHISSISEDEFEEGIYDLAEQIDSSMSVAKEILDRMSSAISELGERVNKRTREIQLLSNGAALVDPSSVKKIADAAGEDLEWYVQRMIEELPKFHEEQRRGMDAMGRLALISGATEDKASIRQTVEALRAGRIANQTTQASTIEFRNSIANSGRFSASFNRARKRAVAITDDVIEAFRSSERQSLEVEQILTQMLGGN